MDVSSKLIKNRRAAISVEDSLVMKVEEKLNQPDEIFISGSTLLARLLNEAEVVISSW